MKKSQAGYEKELRQGESPEPASEVAVVATRGAARLRSGHPWIYRSDLEQRPGLESGAVVRVVDPRRRFLAWAHYGAESEITLRVLSRSEDETIDRQFWRKRLEQAIEMRSRIVRGSDSCRLVHGDGDLLPGLVIDRYGEALVIQTLTQGMESLKALWVELLVDILRPGLIIERNDVRIRQLERLPMITSVLYDRDGFRPGEEVLPPTIITENGLRFKIDLMTGQKTGAFLDQRENRAVAREVARGRGLDCFSFHGSFALHLAAGCDHVTALDISAPAIEQARENAALNGVTNVEFIETNVFDQLRAYDDANQRFETIVLDPPAFARNRAALEGARRGYKEINLRAMRLLVPGGILITCTCSYHVSEALFQEVLEDAARDAGRTLQIIEKRTQGRDHPMMLSLPETLYLKCFVLRMIG
ncbi:MAG: class I SAM-dependent rRNA methyltransferase [Acidobacteria bacterium]|nr:class I SAM-dependent rRNA methyltransferase [Acidobacteriota bacterium]